MAKNRFFSQRPLRHWLFFHLMLVALTGWGLSRAVLRPAEGAEASLEARTYPLPSRLEAVLEPLPGGGDDYLEHISPSSEGYLLWSSWPVQVYLEPSDALVPNTALAQRQLLWQEQAQGAIADWSRYLSLELTDDLAQADIIILRKQPPLRWDNGQLGRARHGETRFRITPDQDNQGRPCLRHQQTVYVGDRQGPRQLRGTLRHELGHALGLWGHSPNPGDALYAGQLAEPPEISQGDLNTLRKLYEQPTRLGCLNGTSESKAL